MGLRTEVPAPVQVRKPVAVRPKAASFRLKVTVKDLVWPAALKFRIEGLTLTLTPGTVALAR